MKTKIWKKIICLLAALCMLTGSAPVVYAEEGKAEEKDRTLSPYFCVESEEIGVDSFPLKKTSVDVKIDGIIADTYVVQNYAVFGLDQFDGFIDIFLCGRNGTS